MTLVEMCLQGSAMILVVLALRALLGRRLPHVTFYALWIVVLARLLVPVSIPMPLSPWGALESTLSPAISQLASDSDQTASSDTEAQIESTPSATTGADQAQTAGLADTRLASSTSSSAGASTGAASAQAGQPAAVLDTTALTSDAQGAQAVEETAPAQRAVDTQATAAQAGGVQTGSLPTGPFASLSPWQLVWCAGALVCAAVFVWLYVRAVRELRFAVPATHPLAQKWEASHQPRLRSLHVRECESIASPMTYGVARPVILVPEGFDWEDRISSSLMLEHELVHVRRMDALLKLALVAALCLYWFDPLVWAMFIYANRDIELSCDSAVVRRLNKRGRAHYARALIDTADPCHSPSYATAFGLSDLERRVRAIVTARRPGLLAAAASVALTFAVPLTLATTGANADPQPIVSPSENGAFAVREDNGTRILTPHYSLYVPDGTLEDGWSWTYDPEVRTEDVSHYVGGSAADSPTKLLSGCELTIRTPSSWSLFSVQYEDPDWADVQDYHVTVPAEVTSGAADSPSSSGEAELMVVTVSAPASNDYEPDQDRARQLLDSVTPLVSTDLTASSPEYADVAAQAGAMAGGASQSGTVHVGQSHSARVLHRTDETHMYNYTAPPTDENGDTYIDTGCYLVHLPESDLPLLPAGSVADHSDREGEYDTYTYSFTEDTTWRFGAFVKHVLDVTITRADGATESFSVMCAPQDALPDDPSYAFATSDISPMDGNTVIVCTPVASGADDQGTAADERARTYVDAVQPSLASHNPIVATRQDGVTHLETPYYCVDIPDDVTTEDWSYSYEGSFMYSFDAEGNPSEPSLGCRLSISTGKTAYMIYVTTSTTMSLGPNGVQFPDLGVVSSDGARVIVYAYPNVDLETAENDWGQAVQDAQWIAQFVTPKSPDQTKPLDLGSAMIAAFG